MDMPKGEQRCGGGRQTSGDCASHAASQHGAYSASYTGMVGQAQEAAYMHRAESPDCDVPFSTSSTSACRVCTRREAAVSDGQVTPAGSVA